MSPIAGDVLGSAAGGAELLMDISSIAPSLSTRKLNSPKAISKPSVLAEVGPVDPETDPMTAVAARSMTSPEAVVGSMSLMLMMGEALLMMVLMTVSMADGALSMAVSMAVLIADGALSMAVSMAVLMADGALSMAVSMAVLMADGALLMADGALSMAVLMADGALSMAVLMVDGALSMAVLMANGALPMAVSMAMVGEGAGESVDPDPVVPTVGAN
jgi:hypothetical protein